jgi:hypothetical protein
MPAKKAAKLRKPNHADADLAIKLYDLRREAEMRKARNFMIMNFNPQSAADALTVIQGFGTQENAWFRQVTGYWDLCSSMVNLGLLHPDLFYASTGEPYLLTAKMEPYLAEIRKTMESPNFWLQIEKAVNSTEAGRSRLALMRKRLAGMRARAAAK